MFKKFQKDKKEWFMRLKIMLAVGCLFILTGCASAGWLSGLFTAKAADKIQVAEKVQGAEVMNNKVAEKVDVAPELNTQAGYQNQTTKTTQTTTTSVGGNQAINNDSKLMELYIDAYNKAETNRARAERDIVKLYRFIIAQFMVLLIKAYVILFFIIKSLLKARDNDDVRDDKFKEDLLATARNRELKAQKEA